MSHQYVSLTLFSSKGNEIFGGTWGSGRASIGYARVSTLDQNADLQRTALQTAGCKRIFTDHGVSGMRASLNKAGSS